MRITAQARRETRSRILETARTLFRDQGFEATTTRDLARAAGIAAGTLFNYFPTKQALALELFGEALARGHEAWRSRRRGDEELAEDLFALIAFELRELESSRAFVGDVLEQALSPLARPLEGGDEGSPAVRRAELELVDGLLSEHGIRGPRTLALHLYWTLWYGVLGFYASDGSPAQERTLAMLDLSMRTFAGSVSSASGEPR